MMNGRDKWLYKKQEKEVKCEKVIIRETRQKRLYEREN